MATQTASSSSVGEQVIPGAVDAGPLGSDLRRSLEVDVADGDDLVAELAQDEDVIGGDPAGADQPDCGEERPRAYSILRARARLPRPVGRIG